METIKSKQLFSQVFHNGSRANHPLVRVCALPCEGTGKVAFVAARRLGNAPFRNRCKRVLREAARLSDMPSEQANVILFATRATHDAHPVQVAEALRSLRKRAGF